MTKEPEDGPAAGARAPRVLVVEDHEDAAAGLRLLLQTYGCQVALAKTGAEALDRAPRFAPDLVICDIGLPGMNGYQVCEKIRADPRLRGVVMVALSGHAASEELVRAETAGFHAYLDKPVSVQALEKVVSEVQTVVPRAT